jgi:hypothetical protein
MIRMSREVSINTKNSTGNNDTGFHSVLISAGQNKKDPGFLPESLFILQISTSPEGYQSVKPMFIFKDASKAIEFYKQAFGAQLRFAMPGPDLPDNFNLTKLYPVKNRL